MSDTPRTDAEVFGIGVSVVRADFARELERAIRENNAKAETACLSLHCRERADGERCPHCPMEFWIKL